MPLSLWFNQSIMNLDITLLGPQGSGKTRSAEVLSKSVALFDSKPRVTNIFLHGMLSSPRALAEALRTERADVVIFDDDVVADAHDQAIAVAGVELYRKSTGRKVMAIYCVLGRAIDLIDTSKI